ncbi:unnamed protein product [Paramecium primaurelia]|uniref:RIIa domain-containing protein n=1 Tax=Paramecium primaurelia TaxID=5886 RepID=A0A8S1PW46_PARPR|nr:unnamed protein product [Paramecium primaurelia]
MASKYLQKYPVPEGFHQILHDFTREVLRDQPEDIIKYGVEYFECMRDGKEFKFESKFNIAKGQAPGRSHLPPKPINSIEQAKKVVETSNQRNDNERKASAPKKQASGSSHRTRQESAGSQASHPEEKKAAKDYINELYQKVEQDIDDIEAERIEANNAFFQPHFDEKDMEKIVKIQASAKGMLVRNQLKQQHQVEPQIVYKEDEEKNVEQDIQDMEEDQ